MLTRALFTLLWTFVVAQRLWEVRISKRHEAALREAGAREHASAQMPWMMLLHTLWLAAMLLEVWLLRRPFSFALGAPALLLFGLGQGLRILAMRTLGERWTVRVVTPTSGEPPVTRGIYRYLRHPNYLWVALEILALPLVHGAYLTSLLFTPLNALLLWVRIRAEERALAETSSYASLFAQRPRFVPKAFSP